MLPEPVVPFEAYAIKYAEHERDARENFITPPPGCSGPMPMDYFVWLLKRGDEAVVVDTGFSAAIAAQRGRRFLQCPTVTLAALGVAADTVRRVILTHLHYDHAGNTALFPQASFVVQREELEFASGRYMAHRFLSLAYEAGDVQRVAERKLQGGVQLVSGELELAPGLWVHRVGGHTAGLQVVQAFTAQGWIVLASDLFHFYANRDRAAPFPIVFHVGEMLDGFEQVTRWADAEELIFPGHDPLVMQRHPADARAPGLVVRLA